jgi:predicted ATPase with chaperone activity
LPPRVATARTSGEAMPARAAARSVESLRQPLEDGSVTESRTAGSAAFPARFQLVAAANPCRRGSRTAIPAAALPAVAM